MLVAITGTPGVGKSTVSSILRRTYRVIDIHSYAEEHDLFEEFDDDAGSYDVDVEKLNESVMSEDIGGTVFIDGHLSHFIDVDLIIVLRCDPRVIHDRLKARGYDDKKIDENVQTEILDVILYESVESRIPTYEIDCTHLTPEEVASKMISILNGDTDGTEPGTVNWSDRMDEWF